MDIVKHISSLLFEHDCVIVPGFGGFVSNYLPAQIHPVLHTFSPPSKTILFNKELKNNDGLLANHMVSCTHISYEKALAEIRSFVHINMQRLSNGETIEWENIGKLFPDKEGNIQFDQTTKTNYFKEAYGTSSFVSPAIRRDYTLAGKPVRPDFEDRRKTPSKKFNPAVLLKIAASLAILFILSIAGYNYFRPAGFQTSESGIFNLEQFKNQKDNTAATTSESDLNKGDAVASQLNPEVQTMKEPTPEDQLLTSNRDIMSEAGPEEAKSENTPDETTKLTESTSDTENPALSHVASSVPDMEPHNPQPNANPAQRMYHLIAGSFQDEENAGELINTYRQHGFEPAIIGPADNGFYRVSIVAYLRKSDALHELRQVRETYNPNIWLLRQ
jgi:cell division septation protein DedD